MTRRLRITILVLAIGLGGFIFLRGHDQAQVLHDSWPGDYQKLWAGAASAVDGNAKLAELNSEYNAKRTNIWGHVIESELVILTVAVALFIAAPLLERKMR